MKVVIDNRGGVDNHYNSYVSDDKSNIEIPWAEAVKIPHLQLRVAWAYGAEIEMWDPYYERWCPKANPHFCDNAKYRIKLSNPNADEIASVREEMLKLEKRLGELS